mgnify:CR=1 FL=1
MKRKLFKFCPHCHVLYEIRLEDKQIVFRICPICGVADYFDSDWTIHQSDKYWIRHGIDEYFMEG